MVIKNRLRFFLFFFFFVSLLFISVKSCVSTKKSTYVEVDADKVDPVPKVVENSESLVNFIEEVKKTKADEERELSLAEIEAKELEEQTKNRIKTADAKKRAKKLQISKRNKLKKRLKEKNRRRIAKQKYKKMPNKKKPRKKFLAQLNLSGGETALNGLSRARLESYSNRLRSSDTQKVYITGFFRPGELKEEGLRRAEKVKRMLISSGVRNKTMYVSSKKTQQSLNDANFNWSNVVAR